MRKILNVEGPPIFGSHLSGRLNVNHVYHAHFNAALCVHFGTHFVLPVIIQFPTTSINMPVLLWN